MGKWRTKQAAMTAAAVVALAVGFAAVNNISDDSGRASIQTLDDPAQLPDSAVLGIEPDTGGETGQVSIPRQPGGTARAGQGPATQVPATPSVERPTTRIDPALIPDGYRIGFRYTDADAPSAVVISRFDFSDERTVFTAPPGANYTAAEWSPARDRILIGYCIGQSPCSIRTVTPDGVASAVLDDGRRPSWSPDGRWILESKPGDNGRDGLWVLPSTGGTAVKIGEAGGLCCGPVAKWSPDSTRIAWSDPQRHVIRVATRDGSGSQTLVDPKDLLQNVSSVGLEWSPNGEQLLVERLVREEQAAPATARPQAAAVNVRAERWHELGEWNALAWAPDGKAVLVQRPKSVTSSDSSCGTAREIGLLALGDGALRSFGDGCSARFSPDRKLLAIAEISRARVVELAGTNDKGTVVYDSDGGFRSRGPQLLCCAWTPGSDALVLTDAEVVVARVDGRARWQYQR